MDWRERIIIDPEVLAGKPIIKGAAGADTGQREHSGFNI